LLDSLLQEFSENVIVSLHMKISICSAISLQAGGIDDDVYLVQVSYRPNQTNFSLVSVVSMQRI